MAERTRRPSPPGAIQRNFEEKTVAERASDLPDEVLEAGRSQTARRDRGHAQVR